MANFRLYWDMQTFENSLRFLSFQTVTFYELLGDWARPIALSKAFSFAVFEIAFDLWFVYWHSNWYPFDLNEIFLVENENNYTYQQIKSRFVLNSLINIWLYKLHVYSKNQIELIEYSWLELLLDSFYCKHALPTHWLMETKRG